MLREQLVLILGDKNCYNIGSLSGDSSINIEESEEDRRASFVDSLLNADGSASTVPTDVTDTISHENQESVIEDNNNSAISGVNRVVESMFLLFSFGCIVKQKVVSEFILFVHLDKNIYSQLF